MGHQMCELIQLILTWAMHSFIHFKCLFSIRRDFFLLPLALFTTTCDGYSVCWHIFFNMCKENVIQKSMGKSLVFWFIIFNHLRPVFTFFLNLFFGGICRVHHFTVKSYSYVAFDLVFSLPESNSKRRRSDYHGTCFRVYFFSAST